MTNIPRSIDEYLATLSDDKRNALEQLRQTIKAFVPEVEECISYRLPTFRLNGKMFVAFGAAKNHCALYPLSSSIVETFKDELIAYKTSVGTIRFQVDAPLPAILVKKILKTRIAELKK